LSRHLFLQHLNSNVSVDNVAIVEAFVDGLAIFGSRFGSLLAAQLSNRNVDEPLSLCNPFAVGALA
jgi:hypothetical protein